MRPYGPVPYLDAAKTGVLVSRKRAPFMPTAVAFWTIRLPGMRFPPMRLHQELAAEAIEGESLLTIGVFDGVHRGHAHIISELRAEAKRQGVLAGVLTFRNHPLSVLRPGFVTRFLNDPDVRIALLKQAGADFVVPVTFDRELSELGAAEFVGLLQEHLRMRGLVIGPDFALGRGREGDDETLRRLGGEMGFSVSVVDPLVDRDGQTIRSTAVREALKSGDVGRVADLLGREFAVTGTVVKGHGRGGPLGFPTANLEVSSDLALPEDGIYAAWAAIGEARYMAATSIGSRPTFADSGHAIESFLLDYDGDLYGRKVRLEFVRRLRDEIKFDSVAALQERVVRDVAETRDILHGAETPS